MYVSAQTYSRYHPSKGYWWEFKDQQQQGIKKSVAVLFIMELIYYVHHYNIFYHEHLYTICSIIAFIGYICFIVYNLCKNISVFLLFYTLYNI